MANKTTTTAIAEELNLLRSALRSDDHLTVQSSGDYDQVRIRLDHDIQISFFFDSLKLLDQSLTIGSVHDLRITKSSNKCPLTNDQWANIRKYFNELIHPSKNTDSLYSVTQLIQDHLLQLAITSSKSKKEDRKSSTVAVREDSSLSTNRFRGADLIFNRILHDKTIDRSQVLIGYEDRFTGIHEIAFNDFKKVHNHEFGIPMHRVRHFKINGRLVWDRTNKVDILTGSDQQNETDGITQKSPLVQGLYHFNHPLQQWTQTPHTPLTLDDPKNPSTNDTCLPQRCHFLTWNILFDYHHSTLIHTSQRYQAILHTLKSLLPDVICLQEVTAAFVTLLLDQTWVQENNYYVILSQSVVNSEQDKSHGQLMLTKNIQPRSFTVCPLDLSEDTGAVSAKKTSKELLIARFGLTSKVTIDLVNLHLPSNSTSDADRKRCETLENIFRKMSATNYMLTGDFNFGDYDMNEQNMLERYKDEVHDLWKDVYNVEENPGFTFDPSRNTCASITSESQINRRLDRYLIHNRHNLSYSIEHLNMTGMETLPTDPLNPDDLSKHINQSDHYALQLIIDFRTRSISHRSALVLLPTTDQWSLIEPFREHYDPSFRRWPPHINLLWPFFDLTDCEDDEQNVLLPLRLLLCQHPAFDAEVTVIESFVENNISYMKLDVQSTERVQQLYEQLKRLFPQCCTKNRDSYNPHMIIAQFENEEQRKQAQSTLTLKEPFAFPVEYVYILQRPHDDDTTPFRIAYQLPLSPVLYRLNAEGSHSVAPELGELFERMSLYGSEASYKRKQEKFEKLSWCFGQMFNRDTLHCVRHSFQVYGSFRLGINGQDVDTVFVLDEVKSNEDSGTSFDETLLRLRDDRNALNDYVASLLETQINGNLRDEIFYCRKIQALCPVVYILFKDQTRVEIAMQIKTSSKDSKTDSDSLSHSTVPILGVYETELLLTHARSPPVFQHLLTFVRIWAQHLGLYGRVYGYLSGYSWSILCAHICHSYLSPISSLATIEHFSIEQFFALVYKFFSTFANFNWSSQPLRLHPGSSRHTLQPQKSSVLNRGAIRILSPVAPFNNTGRSTIKSTRDLIVQALRDVLEMLDTENTITCEDKSNALKMILELKKEFPSEKIKSLVQLTLTSEKDSNELDEWIGWMKSRLAHFINDCEEQCHLVIQPQNEIEYRSNNLEALYSIGFELDEHTLMQQRNFNYWLNQFLDQFNMFPNRKETMKISFKLISIHDWKLARMQPKPQRIRNR